MKENVFILKKKQAAFLKTIMDEEYVDDQDFLQKYLHKQISSLPGDSSKTYWSVCEFRLKTVHVFGIW